MFTNGERNQANGSNNGVENDKHRLSCEFKVWLKKNLGQSPAVQKSIWGKLRSSVPKPQCLNTRNTTSSSNSRNEEHEINSNGTTISQHQNTSTEANSTSNNTVVPREFSKPEPPPTGGVFENEVLSMSNFLRKQNELDFKAIGIIGVGGVGKTALCQKILADQQVRSHFVPRVWISMSKEEKGEDPDPKTAIVKRLLENLGAEENVVKGENDISKLLYALHLQLWGKRYLVVLDDCRESDGLNERFDSVIGGKKWGDQLCLGFPKGYGGRVIVTSRSREVAKRLVGEENLHELLPLRDPGSCWEIYEEGVREEGSEVGVCSNELKEELMKKCGGLPRAAKAMGKIKGRQLKTTVTATATATATNHFVV